MMMNNNPEKNEESSGGDKSFPVFEIPSAAEMLFADEAEKKLYWDRSHYDSPESQMKALSSSSTLYIGNLAFSTRSHNLLSHFSQIGPVRKIHMGLDRFRKTPCGFAFVEYVRRHDALQAVAYLSKTKLDGRVIRVELDAGFQPGRQYGRGVSGGQVRDDRRNTHDPARKLTRHVPKWTPPPGRQAPAVATTVHDSTGSSDYYGPAAAEKRGREDGAAMMDQEMESNKRFREE